MRGVLQSPRTGPPPSSAVCLAVICRGRPDGGQTRVSGRAPQSGWRMTMRPLRRAERSGRLLLTSVAVATSVGGFFADFNRTHLFNAAWPPHARFHDAMTIALGSMLGVSSLYFLHRRESSRSQRSDTRPRVPAATVPYGLTHVNRAHLMFELTSRAPGDCSPSSTVHGSPLNLLRKLRQMKPHGTQSSCGQRVLGPSAQQARCLATRGPVTVAQTVIEGLAGASPPVA